MSWHSFCIHACKISKHSRLCIPEMFREKHQTYPFSWIIQFFTFSTGPGVHIRRSWLPLSYGVFWLVYEKLVTSSISCYFSYGLGCSGFIGLKSINIWTSSVSMCWHFLPCAWKHVNYLYKMDFSFLVLLKTLKTNLLQCLNSTMNHCESTWRQKRNLSYLCARCNNLHRK